MNISEQNVKDSFMKVKVEMASLKDQLVSLAEGQEKLMTIIDELKAGASKKKTPTKKAKKVAEKKVTKKKASKNKVKLKVL